MYFKYIKNLFDMIITFCFNTKYKSSHLINIIYKSIESEKISLSNKTVTPNIFYIYISADEYNKLSPFLSTLKNELISQIKAYIKHKGYLYNDDSILVNLESHPDIEKGEYSVEALFMKSNDSKNSYKFFSNTPNSISTLSSDTESSESDKTIIADHTRIIKPNYPVTLTIVNGKDIERSFDLVNGKHIFGRGDDADYQLEDSKFIMSRKHFIIDISDGIILEDISCNGTFLNNQKIEKVELSSGDLISTGNTTLKVTFNID